MCHRQYLLSLPASFEMVERYHTDCCAVIIQTICDGRRIGLRMIQFFEIGPENPVRNVVGSKIGAFTQRVVESYLITP